MLSSDLLRKSLSMAHKHTHRQTILTHEIKINKSKRRETWFTGNSSCMLFYKVWGHGVQQNRNWELNASCTTSFSLSSERFLNLTPCFIYLYTTKFDYNIPVYSLNWCRLWITQLDNTATRTCSIFSTVSFDIQKTVWFKSTQIYQKTYSRIKRRKMNGTFQLT